MAGPQAVNRRVAAKTALMEASPEAREAVLAPGMFERTGSVAMSVGFLRQRLLIDPRLAGEHRTVQEFVRLHEGAHLALKHPRYLSVARVVGALAAALFGATLLAPAGSLVACGLAAFVALWVDAKYGFTTLWVRAAQEQEADEAALGVMRVDHFASAVKTLDTNKPALRGWARVEHRALYGADWRARLRRVGIDPKES
jgi:hypothetical protein